MNKKKNKADRIARRRRARDKKRIVQSKLLLTEMFVKNLAQRREQRATRLLPAGDHHD
jgi:hypothetical protein